MAIHLMCLLAGVPFGALILGKLASLVGLRRVDHRLRRRARGVRRDRGPAVRASGRSTRRPRDRARRPAARPDPRSSAPTDRAPGLRSRRCSSSTPTPTSSPTTRRPTRCTRAGRRVRGTARTRAPVERLLSLMDESGVDRVVLVQGMSAYRTDNRYTADSARALPGTVHERRLPRPRAPRTRSASSAGSSTVDGHARPAVGVAVRRPAARGARGRLADRASRSASRSS